MAKLLISALVVISSAFSAVAEEPRLQEGRSVARANWADRVEQSRQESARYIGAAVDAFKGRRVRPVPEVSRLSVNLPVTYLEDPTLRYGDVIAVEGRLIVFRGGGAGPHRPSDFEEIDKARTLGGIHDRELHAIDKVLAIERASPR